MLLSGADSEWEDAKDELGRCGWTFESLAGIVVCEKSLGRVLVGMMMMVMVLQRRDVDNEVQLYSDSLYRLELSILGSVRMNGVLVAMNDHVVMSGLPAIL